MLRTTGYCGMAFQDLTKALPERKRLISSSQYQISYDQSRFHLKTNPIKPFFNNAKVYLHILYDRSQGCYFLQLFKLWIECNLPSSAISYNLKWKVYRENYIR